MATGVLPPSLKEEFATHSPRWFTDRGVRLDIPVLFRQGSSDNLFNLNQGLRNFDSMLTKKARARSRFVAYNGGHALPTFLPGGDLGGSIVRVPEDTSSSDPTDAFTSGGDACSGDGGFLRRTIEFFDAALRGRGATSLASAYSLTTDDGAACLRLDALPAATEVPVAGTVTTSGAGAPQYLPVRTGPLTVAGIPRLRATVTTVVPDTRVFLGLAVGTSPADARLVQNNVLPLRAVDAATDSAKAADLPGVAVTVPEGQTLFLVVSPVADAFGLHGSRVPGAAVLEDLVLELPVVPS
jgi:ABC-2 type transport system ATP-binding protein